MHTILTLSGCIAISGWDLQYRSCSNKQSAVFTLHDSRCHATNHTLHTAISDQPRQNPGANNQPLASFFLAQCGHCLCADCVQKSWYANDRSRCGVGSSGGGKVDVSATHLCLVCGDTVGLVALEDDVGYAESAFSGDLDHDFDFSFRMRLKGL